MVMASEPASASTPESSAFERTGHPPEIWMLGPIPPPVTGLTVLTQEVLRALEAAGPVRFLNWSPELPRRSLWMRLKRNYRILASLAQLVARGRVDGEPLYTVANADSGLYVTALVVYVARRLGYTVYLHHHVYAYIDRYDWRMAWIDRCLGWRGVHVVHAEKMKADFCRRYPTQCGFAIVHPSVLPITIGAPRDSPRRPFRLGLLSVLTLAKGLDDAVATLDALRRAGRDVTLTLAGAAPNAASRRIIQQAIAKHPGRVHHLGPVYGDDKTRFYAEIDAFLFPTKTESWGLVLNEALGAGVPVITFDRGCTSLVVGREAGRLVEPGVPFVAPAVAQIERWIDHEDEYRQASRAAVAQAELLREAGRHTLDDFVRLLFSDAAARSGRAASARVE